MIADRLQLGGRRPPWCRPGGNEQSPGRAYPQGTTIHTRKTATQDKALICVTAITGLHSHVLGTTGLVTVPHALRRKTRRKPWRHRLRAHARCARSKRVWPRAAPRSADTHGRPRSCSRPARPSLPCGAGYARTCVRVAFARVGKGTFRFWRGSESSLWTMEGGGGNYAPVSPAV